jgi:dienelactone hydrolase
MLGSLRHDIAADRSGGVGKPGRREAARPTQQPEDDPMRTVLALTLTAALAGVSAAAVKTQEVAYEYQGTKLKGLLAYDDSAPGKRPGVLVFHEWWGLDEYAKKRAEQLAGMGYVAFAADMYGEGKMADHPTDAKKMADAVRANADAWRGRAQAALKVLQGHEKVDGAKLAAIGYCFGGSTALQLAYGGADLDAVVTFHAGLPTPTPEQAKAVKAKVLVCHGADDKFIKPDSIEAFKKALDAAKVDYKLESYPGAVHSFTVPDADKRKIDGMGYHADADKKSWAAMKALFDQVLAVKK